jgi:hypothetical protein
MGLHSPSEINDIDRQLRDPALPVEKPTPNLPLLRKALSQIRIPGAWDQTSWMRTTRSECGTTGCIAGWAVALIDRYDLLFNRVNDSDELFVEMVQDRETGEEEYVEVVAARELGLTDREAEVLFDGGNTYSFVVKVAEMIAERGGEKL